MTLPIPLTVRLKTARADRHVKNELRSLRTRSVQNGGFAHVQFALDRPLTLTPDELAYFGHVYVYDERNGQVVGEGRTEDLGRSATGDGQVWEIAAIGPAAHAADDAFPYIPIDSEGERWLPSEFTANPRSRTRVEQTNLDDDISAVRLMWEASATITSVAPVSTIDVIYRAIYYAGGEVAHIRAAVKNGQTHSNHENRIVTRQAPSGSTSVVANATVSTSETVMAASLGGTNAIPSGHSVVSLRMQRIAGGTTTLGAGDDSQYGDWYGIFVRAKLKNKAGMDITTGYTDSFVFAHEIVADLLGRFLPLYDGANAVIESTTYHVDHLCYPGGTTAREVLDHLISLEPGFQWFAWESNSAGKHRFEWVAQPTTVRYEADVVDGYDGPSSAVDLYNKALIAYTDWKGRYHTVAGTQSVQALTDAGITRTLQVDLGSERSSAANATQAGGQQLAEYASPPNAGTLTIARPIYDHNRGTSVMPWEIRPGNLIRVRGIAPNLNSLNATDRDGVTVFRIVAVDYDTTSASATLELDSHPLSVSRALAELARRGRRRRI